MQERYKEITTEKIQRYKFIVKLQRDQNRKDIKRSIQKKYKEIIKGKKQRETTIAVAIVERAINI